MSIHGHEGVVQETSDRIRETVDEMKPKLRGWLHAVTLPVAFFAFIVMLVIADDVRVRVGVAVFMVSSMLLFGVSAVYHRGTWNDRVRGFWKRFDHANIFLLIAGSYTPFSLLLLTPRHATIMLTLVWSGALLGVAFKIFWIGAPRWLYVPLYLVLGWAAVLYFPEFVENSSTAVMVMLVGGGVLYTLGAIVYGFKWPDPSPTYFGFHEIFHAFTIAAFIVHYIGVSLLAYQQY
ncbi:PAQR family membrane homeostasis protein TrhA [Aeromicrobium wangtongii]|uniref:Hemolysin III family protein n=1 Tax=Aeromicrobium wangtongii TaxID=2969247 RepID=A0ABY5MCU1_9ACTN|nr:hemolysin III family protein [Aeromicrobium wangtongii]MCD9196987.1 hemolysin III family protein [Aeromicrobium wangtongii]UUP14488.1 hemolysin III family protein [Aeromicrobium wangtongii]